MLSLLKGGGCSPGTQNPGCVFMVSASIISVYIFPYLASALMYKSSPFSRNGLVTMVPDSSPSMDTNPSGRSFANDSAPLSLKAFGSTFNLNSSLARLYVL